MYSQNCIYIKCVFYVVEVLSNCLENLLSKIGCFTISPCTCPLHFVIDSSFILGHIRIWRQQGMRSGLTTSTVTSNSRGLDPCSH